MKTIYLCDAPTPRFPNPDAFPHCPDIRCVHHKPLAYRPDPVAYLQYFINLYNPNVAYTNSHHTIFHLLSTNLPSTSASPIIGLVHFNPLTSTYTHHFHQRYNSSLLTFSLSDIYPNVKL